MITQALLLGTICPSTLPCRTFLAHSALRLSAVDQEYWFLWHEQLREEWREASSTRTWPVIDGDGERWKVRAAIDAVVADAYELGREEYADVLAYFKHRIYPNAPQLCLAMFDELKSTGLEAFTKEHDPYWDIPLNESLPFH